MTLEEVSGPPIDVWPDNLATVNTFIAMSTQWRNGMNGPTGLDYGVLPAVLRMGGIQRKEWAVVFDGIRTMEQAALSEMHEKRK